MGALACLIIYSHCISNSINFQYNSNFNRRDSFEFIYGEIDNDILYSCGVASLRSAPTNAICRTSGMGRHVVQKQQLSGLSANQSYPVSDWVNSGHPFISDVAPQKWRLCESRLYLIQFNDASPIDYHKNFISASLRGLPLSIIDYLQSKDGMRIGEKKRSLILSSTESRFQMPDADFLKKEFGPFNQPSPSSYDFYCESDGSISWLFRCTSGVDKQSLKLYVQSGTKRADGGSDLKLVYTYVLPDQEENIGDFRIIRSRGHLFIVASGSTKVYFMPTKRVAEQTVNAIAMKNPVLAVITDNDRNKVYAYTKSDYYELGEFMKLMPHEISFPERKADDASSLLSDVSFPLLMKCARLIRGIPEPKAK